MTFSCTANQVSDVIHHAQVRSIRLHTGGLADCSPQVSHRNERRTRKYSTNPIDREFFLWKNLWEQFQQVPNIYFLVMAALALVPGLSPFGAYTILLEFGFFISCSALKAACEDYFRQRADHAVNSQLVPIFKEGSWLNVQCKDLQVGDIVRVSQMEIFPADMLLLSSSNEGGKAYMQTSALDGDSNVKMKQSPSITAYRASENMLPTLELTVRYEDPTANLHSFSGTACTGSQRESLGSEHLLLRGAQLLQTEFIFGLVLYAGVETKVMKNVHKDVHKRSTMQKQLDVCLWWILAILLIMACVCTAGNLYHELKVVRWFRIGGPHVAVKVITHFFTFLLLFHNVVPIAMLFSVEVIKAIQGFFIQQDVTMYQEANDQPALAWSTNLNEELGQVQCVFMDKTGTLTQNELNFFKFAVEGLSYGQHTTQVGHMVALENGRNLTQEAQSFHSDTSVIFSDNRIDNGQWQQGLHSQEIYNLFCLMAVCHTAVPHHDPSGEVIFQAQSQEDVALLKAAHRFGFKLLSRNSRQMVVEIDGIEHRYEILNVFPFTPERSLMSVIVRTPDDMIVLYAKGAESALFTKLNRDGDQIERTRMLEHIRSFANEGLRTLLCAGKTLQDEHYEDWNARFIDASRRYPHDLERCMEDLEHDLDLIGVVAIEDTLQPEVRQTIATMAGAGLKMWMLTGDKRETAVNIAYACGLLGINTEVIPMEARTLNETYSAFDYAMQVTGGTETTRCTTEGLLSPRTTRKARMITSAMDHALVIDSVCLDFILLSPDLMDALMTLSLTCRAVICCRANPAQKADLVKAVRTRAPMTVTLAIGDGANDVGMIQAAHVGVAIVGKEGMQAVSAAEYALGQFSFLTQLLFVHGRWNHIRIGKLVLFCFYKNILLVTTELCFQLLNEFSGQALYKGWTVGLWNVLWTFFPVVVFAVLEQDVGADTAKSMPTLYNFWEFTHHTFLQWVALAFWHGIIIFVVVMAYSYRSMLPSGHVCGLPAISCLMHACCLFVSNTKLAMETCYWTWVHIAALVGSSMAWFTFWLVLESSPVFSWDSYEVFSQIGSCVSSFFVVLLTVVLALGFDFCHTCYRHHILMPQDRIIMARYEEKGLSRPGAGKQSSPRSMRLKSIASVPRPPPNIISRLMVRTRAMGQQMMSTVSLRFFEPDVEDEFRVNHIRRLIRYGVGLMLGSTLAFGIALYHTLAASPTMVPVFWYAFCGLAAALGAVVFWRQEKMVVDIHYYMLLLLVPGFCFIVAAHMLTTGTLMNSHPVTFTIVTWGLLTVLRPLFQEAVQYIVAACVIYLGMGLLIQAPGWGMHDLFVRWYEVAVVNGIALATLYQAEQVSRGLFSTSRLLKEEEQTLKQEREVAEALLLDMMPRQIINVINRHRVPLRAFSMPFTECSILQSDIVNSTAFEAEREPAYVVKLLNRMFVKFDEMASRLKVEKIKTIGDAYLAAAGVPAPDEHHANKIALLGLCLVDLTHEVNAEFGEQLEIRVGIATGPIHGGFLGRRKVAYELYGSTLHEAERMEQTSNRMRVQCTPGMAPLLRTSFDIEKEQSTGKFFVSALFGDIKDFMFNLDYGHEGRRGGIDVPYNRDDVEHAKIDPEQGDFSRALTVEGPEDIPICGIEWQEEESHPITITGLFKDAALEERFRRHQYAESYKRRVRSYIMGLISLFLIIPLLRSIFSRPDISYSAPMLIIYISIVLHLVALIFSLVYHPKDHPDLDEEMQREQQEQRGFRWHVGFSFLSSGLAIAVTVSAMVTLAEGNGGQIVPVSCFIMMILLLGMQLSYCHFLFSQRKIISFLHVAAVIAIFCGLLDSGYYQSMWTHIVAWMLSLLLAYFQELETRQMFVAATKLGIRKKQLTAAKKHCEYMLYKVLPQSIVQRVCKNPDEPIVDDCEDASVLFAYFHIGEDGENGGIVKLMSQLNEFVSELDMIVESTPGVEKIKTLPYLVVSGLPDPNDDHAPALASVAQKMFRAVSKMKDPDLRCKLRFKIGIHTGRVCAGLLGKNKFIYDVFGDTVNLASRLANASVDGRALVSDAFVQAMKKRDSPQEFEERGVIPLKNHPIAMRCHYLQLPEEGKQPSSLACEEVGQV